LDPKGAAGPADDFDLMTAIAAGDASALSVLYDRHAAAVMGVGMRILRDRAEADELTGDVFIELWNRADRFDPSRGHPVAYVLGLARSRAIDRLRSRTRRDRVFVAPGEHNGTAPGDPFNDSSNAQMRSLLDRALSGLHPGQRQALELAYFDGMSHSEVAQATGEPLGTVKTRIRQGILRLREALAAVYGEGETS
jgi:RNA polymerase sigma-70 factor (ECF subfamily)